MGQEQGRTNEKIAIQQERTEAVAGCRHRPEVFDQVSQFAHFFTMYSLALTLGLTGKRTGHARLCFALSVAVYITYAAIHEFY